MSSVFDSKIIWRLALTQPKREVLRAYLDCSDASGVSNPGIQQIAWMTDYHIRQVQRITHALEQDGILLATPRAGKTTEYRFDFSKAAKKPTIGEGVTIVTPDTIVSSPEMSPLTLDVTTQNVTPDIQMSPHVAGAASSPISSLPEVKDKDLKDKKAAAAGARVVALYENLLGVPVENRVIADGLVDDANTYPPEWIEKAVAEAAFNKAKNWKYVRKILSRWQLEGFPEDTPKLNGNGKAHSSQKPVIVEKRTRSPALEGFDANKMLADMKAAGTINPGWNPFEEGNDAEKSTAANS